MQTGIENSIVNLLRKHDCVVVPDFGGFVLSRKPAYFSAGGHELCPPAKHLGFNRSLNHNDGLLATHVAQVAKIDFSEALQLIQDTAARWKASIEQEGLLELAGLGRFQLMEEQKWSFTPFREETFLLSSYGLGNLQIVPAEPAGQPKIPAHAEPLKQLKKLGSKRRVWTPRRLVAALSIGALIAVGSFLGYHKMHTQPVEMASVFSTESKPTIKKDSPVAVINNLINDAKLAPEKSVGVAPVQHFYLIGGSFSQKKNAQKFANELKAKGYAAKVMANEAGFFRVSYMTESDSLVADQHLQAIRQENPTAWLLKW